MGPAVPCNPVTRKRVCGLFYDCNLKTLHINTLCETLCSKCRYEVETERSKTYVN